MTCRKTHGAPFHAFAIFPTDAVTISGPTRSWSSSPDIERIFCPTCGSHVMVREGGEIELLLGGFDAPSQFTPTYEAWVGRREAWLPAVAARQYAANREGTGRTE
jgi:hypothetical protein